MTHLFNDDIMVMNWRNNMEIIDKNHLDSVTQDTNSKNKKAVDCSNTMLQFFYLKKNIFYYIKKWFTLHELALWIKSIDTYLKKKHMHVTQKYEKGDIVLVELGSNIGGDLSYQHPCVVIQNQYDKVFVVPCSSSKVSKAYNKKTGKLHDEYIIAETTDGFSKKTAIITNNAKWISKASIIKKYANQVDPELFKEIYSKTFSQAFKEKKSQIDNLEKIKENLTNDKKSLEEKYDTIQSDYDKIQKELEDARCLIKELESKVEEV